MYQSLSCYLVPYGSVLFILYFQLFIYWLVSSLFCFIFIYFMFIRCCSYLLGVNYELYGVILRCYVISYCYIILLLILSAIGYYTVIYYYCSYHTNILYTVLLLSVVIVRSRTSLCYACYRIICFFWLLVLIYTVLFCYYMSYLSADGEICIIFNRLCYI
jgi:hypothetical protein